MDTTADKAQLITMAECAHGISQASLTDFRQTAFPARTVVTGVIDEPRLKVRDARSSGVIH